MRSSRRVWIVAISVLLLGIAAHIYSNGNSGPPPSGLTGSLGDGGASCTSCHTGGSSNPSSNLAFASLPSEYSPSQTYNFTLTLNAGSAQGFEITAERLSDNANVGTWTTSGVDASTTRIGSASEYVAHNPKNQGTSKTWNLRWTAPSSGQGSIKFYAVGNAANNNGSNGSGDVIHFKTQTMTEASPPGTPSGLAGTVQSTGSIKWDWTDTTGETGYRLVTSTGGVVSADLAAGTTTHTETDLLANAITTRKIRAFNTSGTTDSSAATSTTTAAVPEAPSVSARASTTLTFAWSQNNASGTTYEAELATASFNDAAALLTSATLNASAQFMDLTPNSTYFLRVRTQAHDGATTDYTSELSTPTKANAPASTSVSATTDAAVVTWEANSNPSGTRYAADRDVASTFATAVSSETLGLSATFQALTPNTTYFFRARANGHDGESQIGSTQTAVTRALSPSGSALEPVTDASASLSWTNPGNPTGTTLYRLEVSTAGDFTGTVFSSETLNTSATVANLLPNTTYHLQVQAASHAGVGTSFDALRTTATLARAPTVSSVDATTGSVQLSWSDNDNPSDTDYTVKLSSVSDFTGAVASSVTTSTALGFGGLAQNTTSYLRLFATSRHGADTSVASTTTVTLAIAPTGSAVPETSETSVGLSWDNPFANRSVAELSISAGFLPVAQTLATFGSSVTFAGLTPNTTYQARVRSENHAGVATAFDATKTTSTLANAPSGSSPFDVGIDSITLGWSAESNPVGTTYEARLATGSFAATPALSASVVTSTEAVFSSLSVNTTYFLQVRAVGHGGTATSFDSELSTSTRAKPPASTAFQRVTTTESAFGWSDNGNPSGTRYAASLATTEGFASPLSSSTLEVSATFQALTPNTSYYARVRAFSRAGAETAFDSTASTVTPAAAPSGLAFVSVSSITAALSWSASDNPGDTSYTLEASETDFGTVAASSVTENAQATLGGLTPSATYFFRVKATDRAGRDTAFTATSSTRTATPLVDAPSDLAAQALSTGSIRWTWSAVPFADSYEVLVASDATLLASGVAVTTFDRGGLPANTAHGVRVRASNGAGAGPLSSAATAFTLADAPSGTSAAVLSSASVRVAWSTANASGYEVQRSTFSGGGFAVVASSASLGTATQFNDAGLAPASTFFYQVRGYNGDGVATAFDAEASTATLPAPPGAPALAGVALSSESVRWSWSVSGGAASSLELRSTTGTAVVPLSASATFYVEPGLSPDTAYARFLRATNASASTDSSTATVRTPAAAEAVAVPAASSATLAAADGTRLELPAGALASEGVALLSDDPVGSPLTEETPALIASANAKLPATLKGASSSIREFVVIVGEERFSANLGAPAVVRVPYPDAGGDGFVDGVAPPLRAKNLVLHVLNEATQEWEAVAGSTVDEAAKVVSGSAPHLSIFGAFGRPAAANLVGLKVYPNPWRPGSGGLYDSAGVLFDNLTQDATIRIYTVTGELVRRLSKTAADGSQKAWDGASDGGGAAASGVYLYLVTTPAGERATGRVAIIR